MSYENELVPSLKIAEARNVFADKLMKVIAGIFFAGICLIFSSLYFQIEWIGNVGLFTWLVVIGMTVYLFVYNLKTSKYLDKAHIEIMEMRPK